MTIIGMSGAIGSGKSFSQLKSALEYCEQKRKSLTTNFYIDARAAYHYCKMRRLHWCQYMFMSGGWTCIESPEKLESLMIPNSVVCLDEAGIFLNSRQFASTSKKLLADLAQSRKQGTDLIWAAQFDEQVDKQLRLLTQYWVHCDSMSVYDKKMRRPRLVWKRIYWMRGHDFNHWQYDRASRSSHWKTRIAYSFQYEGGPLTKADKQLFLAFDSFRRLDDSRSRSLISSTNRYDFSLSDLARMALDCKPKPSSLVF